MPNLWEDLSNTHGISEHWNRFVRLKNKFSSKHCGTCGHTGTHCCHSDQMLRRLPDEMRPYTYSTSSIRHKCSMILSNRCVAENFKPPVCIEYFCNKTDKAFKRNDIRFIKKFTGVLMRLLSLYYELDDRHSRDGGWSLLLEAYFERNPEEHSRFMKHIKDTLGIDILYPPVITKYSLNQLIIKNTNGMTICSIPETEPEPYIPLWR